MGLWLRLEKKLPRREIQMAFDVSYFSETLPEKTFFNLSESRQFTWPYRGSEKTNERESRPVKKARPDESEAENYYW